MSLLIFCFNVTYCVVSTVMLFVRNNLVASQSESVIVLQVKLLWNLCEVNGVWMAVMMMMTAVVAEMVVLFLVMVVEGSNTFGISSVSGGDRGVAGDGNGSDGGDGLMVMVVAVMVVMFMMVVVESVTAFGGGDSGGGSDGSSSDGIGRGGGLVVVVAAV